MYILNPGVKQDLERQWQLPDRIFFGYGACHILAYAFLERFPQTGFEPIWIKPAEGYRGNHVFVTDGSVSFDYHGYSKQQNLLGHHYRNYEKEYPGWGAEQVIVHDNLTDPEQMAAIGMFVRSPSQYLHNALPRARSFLDKYNHRHALYVAA